MSSGHNHGAGPANKVVVVLSRDSHQCVGWHSPDLGSHLSPSSGFLSAGARHPDPSSFKGTYKNGRCRHALKRGKQFANFWKTGKHLKDINDSGLGIFFPAEVKCDENCNCTYAEVNRSK